MSKKKLPINVGVALEGTISGANNRARFATKICKLDNYIKLLEHMQHLTECAYQVRASECTCGLYEFLREE